MRTIMSKLVPLLLGILLFSASVPMAFGGDEPAYKEPVTSTKKALNDEELSQVTAGGFLQVKSLLFGKLLLIKSSIWSFKSNLKNRFHSQNQTMD